MHKRFKRALIYQDKTQHANFRGNPKLQIVSYKSTLKQQLNGKKNKKRSKMRAINTFLIYFLNY